MRLVKDVGDWLGLQSWGALRARFNINVGSLALGPANTLGGRWSVDWNCVPSRLFSCLESSQLLVNWFCLASLSGQLFVWKKQILILDRLFDVYFSWLSDCRTIIVLQIICRLLSPMSLVCANTSWSSLRVKQIWRGLTHLKVTSKVGRSFFDDSEPLIFALFHLIIVKLIMELCRRAKHHPLLLICRHTVRSLGEFLSNLDHLRSVRVCGSLILVRLEFSVWSQNDQIHLVLSWVLAVERCYLLRRSDLVVYHHDLVSGRVEFWVAFELVELLDSSLMLPLSSPTILRDIQQCARKFVAICHIQLLCAPHLLILVSFLWYSSLCFDQFLLFLLDLITCHLLLKFDRNWGLFWMPRGSWRFRGRSWFDSETAIWFRLNVDRVLFGLFFVHFADSERSYDLSWRLRMDRFGQFLLRRILLAQASCWLIRALSMNLELFHLL